LIRAEIFPCRLPLARPWVAAATVLTERRGALLRLTDAAGIIGWGDCAPLPSGGDADAVLDALDAYARRVPGADLSALPCEARWTIKTALADIIAQRAGLPLWRYLGGEHGEVAVNAALGPLDDTLLERIASALRQGFRVGKIKVGLAPVEEEIARLRALPTGLRLRLDANRTWSDDEASRFLLAIADLAIDAVEEPLAHPTLEKLAALQARLPYALALDESLPAFPLDELIASRAVRRFVVKPARLGGCAATLSIARAAQEAGIEVALTSVVDSAIGVAAAAHLAAAVSPALAHGLATSAWLAADLAAPPPIEAGRMWLPETAGLGLTPATVPVGG
jgi:o-succinylbenzoate synthase